MTAATSWFVKREDSGSNLSADLGSNLRGLLATSWHEPLLSEPPMFFLRCAFWLSIVYASMSWTPGTLAPGASGSDLVAMGRSQAESLIESAKSRVADYCVHHARECLDDAARLTALVGAPDPVDGQNAGEPEVTAMIPLPVPDPRRHVRDAKLAHIP